MIVLAIFSIGFYSCDDDEDNDNKSEVVSQQDSDFAEDASFSNINEIEIGELALQKSANDSVIAFARTMITGHVRSQAELDAIADSLELNLPDDMDPTHQTLFMTLSALNTAAFDSAYMHNQVLDHEATRTVMETQRDMGSHASLVNYAKRKLPGVNMHLQRAINIRDMLDDE